MKSKWIKHEIIPKGKWIRTRNGYIQYRISEAPTWIDVLVANTPQELVQVGDLVFVDLDLNKGTWGGWYMIDESMDLNEFSTINITKILTPNSKGGYDLQYAEER